VKGHVKSCRARPIVLGFAFAATVTLSWSASARAQQPTPDTSTTAPPASATPPALDTPYLQYGVAITTEFVTDAGTMCATPGVPYPYVTASSGVVGYGDEWGIDTYGPIESLGLGFETQISRRTVVGVSLSYRVLLLKDFRDSGGNERAESFAQMLGIDLFVEERSPTVSALARQ
jgi:hypothetical protein